MHSHNLFFSSLVKSDPSPVGGLFLDIDHPLCPSLVSLFASRKNRNGFIWRSVKFESLKLRGGKRGVLCSVSLSINSGRENEEEEGFVGDGTVPFLVEEKDQKKDVVEERGSAALNTSNHLIAGAVAAMVSRTFVAPLERLKMEYVVRGEQKQLFELIKTISMTQGVKGFWKGNFVNILRTAPFKSINFYAYDRYRNLLLKWSRNEAATNFDRFVAGAGAGITATLLCLPMDTIRTKMLAPGGEALGGVIGTFGHMIRTEGFFSLYKGLLPAIVAMAPSGAVFYGVYDILKSAYLHSPDGRKRIAGCCSEAATYPFEVVRRHLQMQVQATKMNALVTCVKIVEQGGFPALYAGLIPSLLQVLPSAAISYFMYEFMKIVLKVD